MKYIIAIGIFQALLTAILLLRSRYRSSADDLLISLVICISLHLSIKFYIFNYVSDTDVVAMLNTFIWFSYLPLLYLYTLKAIQKDFIPATKWYVFIPFFICAIGYFSVISLFLAGSTESHKVLYWYNEISLWLIIPIELIFPCLILYIALKKLPESAEEKKLIIQISALFFMIGIISFVFIVFKPYLVSVSYLSRSLVYGVLIIISIRIIAHRYVAVNSPFKQGIDGVVDFSATNYNTVPAISGVYNGMSNSAFVERPTAEIISKPISISSPKEVSKRKELLGQSDMFKILLKLENAMKSGQYFKDSELTLDKLSKLSKLNKHHISETLNHFVDKPFYTFVNEYRIQFVKDRLSELALQNDKINILELAFESGFNSKSSFNRYFKEITTLTPSEYVTKIVTEVE